MIKQILNKKYVIESSVFYRKDLNTSERLIYILLCGLADDNKQIQGVSYTFIANRCGMHLSTTVRRINGLRSKGYINIVQRRITSPYSDKPTKITNIYTILDKAFDYSNVDRCGYHGAEVIILREQ